ncbi:unnamed protein product [Phytophthora fragariaefolia]|uniref:Unnamed protein product n=1 Tax=Phytophthora fragariaefolia TaxID=1490495 RepID=A0A9W7D6V2_9STRA|nr:unnamed protein product [Phytophthora fragariaefolia]
MANALKWHGSEAVPWPRHPSLLDDVRSVCANDADAKHLLNYFAAPSDKSRQKLAKHLRARVHQYPVHNGLLLYSAVDENADRVVVPDDHELKLRIPYEYQDGLTSGHPGREKTYFLLTRDFYWSHQYKWVRKYVRACEVGQRVKPTPFSQASLQSLPTPLECWQSISMDLVFGLPPDSKRRTGIVVFVDRFSKMVLLAAVPAEVTAKPTALLFVDMVFRHHGMPIDIETLSTPGVDTLNHNEQHPQAGPVVNKDAELNTKFSPKAMDFVQRQQAVIRFVQDAIAASVDRQKLNADNNGRGNANEFKVVSLVLLATQNLAKHTVSDFGESLLAPRFIGPFIVLAKHGNAYTLDIPSSMRLHPTF